MTETPGDARTVAAAGMGSVQFAEQFAQQVLEVVVVVDVGEEAGIIRVVVVPVGPMEVFDIELFLDLFPGVLEDVRAFFSGFEFELAAERDVVEFVRGEGQPLEGGAAENEEALSVRRGGETAADILAEYPDIPFFNIQAAQVVAFFQLLGEIQLAPVRGQEMVPDVGCMRSQAAEAVIAGDEVQHEFFDLLVGAVLLLFLFGLLGGFFTEEHLLDVFFFFADVFTTIIIKLFKCRTLVNRQKHQCLNAVNYLCPSKMYIVHPVVNR